MLYFVISRPVSITVRSVGLMHEISVAESILESAVRLIPESARLETVCVSVGELSTIEPDLLRFAWEALTGNTPHDRANLEIQWCEARQYCPRCDRAYDRPSSSWMPACPRCSQPLEIQGGYELDLLKIAYLEGRPSSKEDRRVPAGPGVLAKET